MQNKYKKRVVDAKLALRGTTEVIHRGGLSSWIVILDGLVGMLSGSWGGNPMFGRTGFIFKNNQEKRRLIGLWPHPEHIVRRI